VIIPNSAVFFKISRDSKLPCIQDNRSNAPTEIVDRFAKFPVIFPASRGNSHPDRVRSSLHPTPSLVLQHPRKSNR
jgi:hypothetical protein